MRNLMLLSLMLISVFLMFGCSDKPQVNVETSYQKPEQSVYSVVRVNATLLREPPKNLMDRPPSILNINQGDQIVVLETKPDWSRIQHVVTGNIGWLNNGFIQVESRSTWWSGDTDRARRVAEMIYKDKVFLEREWPVLHINIEERWNKLVFTVKQSEEFSKEEATKCAIFAMDNLLKEFPAWRDHQVFLEGTSEAKPYTLVMSDSKVPVFL